MTFKKMDHVSAPFSLNGTLFEEPIVRGTPIVNVACFDCAFGKEGGRDVLYTTVSGHPACFQVVDLVQQKVLRKFPLPDEEGSWSHITLPNGDVYIGGSGGGKLYAYSPETKQLSDLGGIGETVLYGLSFDERGRVYFGSYPNGKAGQYDPATGQLRDYGAVAPGETYTKSTAYSDGYFVGTGMQGSIVKIDVETGEKETIALPDCDGAVVTGMVYQLDVCGRYLAAGVSTTLKPLLFYDMKSGRWAGKQHRGNMGIRLSPGKPGSGKAYFIQENRLMELDSDSLEAVDTGVAFGSILRYTGWVTIPGDSELPGESLATITWGGAIALMNLETKKTKSIDCRVEGSPIPIQTLEKGPEGKLYMSGYPGGKGASFCPETSVFESFGLGQAEGMAALGGMMYMGIYPKASIVALDPAQPLQAQINPRPLFSIPRQDRPFIMVTDGHKLFIGTIPDYGKLGGSLTVYDPSTEAAPAVYENVVHDQSIVGLAIRDGTLYGSTTVAGGLGIEPTQYAAKLFKWDIASGTMLLETIPSIPGLEQEPVMISGLSFGGDGLLWAAADGAIFAMHPQTLEVVKSRVIYPGVSRKGRWRPIYLRWAKDGLLYTTLNEKLTVIDPNTLEFNQLAETPLMTVGDDGHLYYADGAKLKQIKVNSPTAR